MKERPILMNAPMVRALLDGRKTQTRRLVKPAGAFEVIPFLGADAKPTHSFGWCPSPCYITKHIRCPYGQPGDRLWVRETWRPVGDAPLSECVGPRDVDFKADACEVTEAIHRWRPSIHMPRWASRITLEVTDVRVERLQAISVEGCLAEGIDTESDVFSEGESLRSAGSPVSPERYAFTTLWESINGAGSWDANPWVWAITFRRLP